MNAMKLLAGPRWIVGLAAAAMVAGLTGCAAVAADPGGGGPSPIPVPAPSATEAADLAAAEAMAAAFAAHDIDAATQYLRSGSELWDGWVRHWERDAAWDVEVLMEPCVRVPSSSLGTQYTCPFAMHAMGSKEVGSGPFGDNALTLRVYNGEVTSAHREIAFQTNGLVEHFDAVNAWLEATHPADVAFLGEDELSVAEDRWPTWLELWNTYVAEYVAANPAG